MKKADKFIKQEKQYEFPYHYLVNFETFSKSKRLPWGIEYYSYIIRTIRCIAELPSKKSLLDVGCGDGKLINEISKDSSISRIVGVDLSQKAIHLAKGLNDDKRVMFSCSDVENVDGVFDVVILNEVIEHISTEDIGVFAENVINKISQGGFLIITVPSKNIPVNKKHYRHYDLKMLKETFSGLKLFETDYIFKNNFFTNIYLKFFNKFNIPRLEFFIGKKCFFKAKPNNCRHIFAVFKK